jgi:hypothetical protein
MESFLLHNNELFGLHFSELYFVGLFLLFLCHGVAFYRHSCFRDGLFLRVRRCHCCALHFLMILCRNSWQPIHTV